MARALFSGINDRRELILPLLFLESKKSDLQTHRVLEKSSWTSTCEVILSYIVVSFSKARRHTQYIKRNRFELLPTLSSSATNISIRSPHRVIIDAQSLILL